MVTPTSIGVPEIRYIKTSLCRYILWYVYFNFFLKGVVDIKYMRLTISIGNRILFSQYPIIMYARPYLEQIVSGEGVGRGRKKNDI